MLSYSPLTLPADRLFFDEETKKFYDKTTGDEVSGWNLADGYTVYAQISKGGSCFAYRGLHEGRFVIVKELIPASFCPFLTRREDGSIVFMMSCPTLIPICQKSKRKSITHINMR